MSRAAGRKQRFVKMNGLVKDLHIVCSARRRLVRDRRRQHAVSRLECDFQLIFVALWSW